MDQEDVLLGEGLLTYCTLVRTRRVQKFLHCKIGPLPERQGALWLRSHVVEQRATVTSCGTGLLFLVHFIVFIQVMFKGLSFLQGPGLTLCNISIERQISYKLLHLGLAKFRMSILQVLPEGQEGPKAALAKAAHGGRSDSVVLGVDLELLHGLEGQAAVVAAVLVDVAIRHRELLLLLLEPLELTDMVLQGVRGLAIISSPARSLPAWGL